MATRVLLAAILALTAGAATPCPATGLSANIRLVAHVTYGDLNPSVQDGAVSSYHTSPCYDYAVLVPNNSDAADFSRPFTSTARRLKCGMGLLIS